MLTHKVFLLPAVNRFPFFLVNIGLVDAVAFSGLWKKCRDSTDFFFSKLF